GNSENSSYTIHLDGEWGSGKSSVLKMLEKKLTEDKWIVVNYNAWQNQHLETPWWVMLNKTFHTITSRLGWLPKWHKWVGFFIWKYKKANWQLIVNILLFILILLIVVLLGVFGVLKDFFGISDDVSSTLDFILSIISLITFIW